MERVNNRTVFKVITILTSDLDLIENNASDVYPYAIWVDKKQAEEQGELRTFLLDYETEYNMLINGDIDYIIIEYDM